MTLETSLPTADTPAAAGDATIENPQLEAHGDLEAGEPKPEAAEGEKAKPEKSPEQREIDRLRRGIDRRTRQLAELRATMQLTPQRQEGDNPRQSADSERLSLTQAELDDLIATRAKQLAPQIKDHEAEAERRTSVVQKLATTWGQEKFDAISSDLDDAFGGLSDRSGRPKPAIEAVFEADDPVAVIEFLADPENAAEAERISKLNATRAGREIAHLEARLKTEREKAKPKASSAAAPLEPVRGGGKTTTDGPDPSDTKAWIRWRNEQSRKGL